MMEVLLQAAEHHADSSHLGLGWSDLEGLLRTMWDATEDWPTVRNTFLADDRVTELLCSWGVDNKCEGCQTESAETWHPHDSMPGEVLCQDCYAVSR